MRESRDPSDRKKQQNSHEHRQTEANSAGLLLLMRRKFPGQDRYENDVIDS
jgi:hypothetical protein